ncbi:lipoprotein [Streptomyces seoulensis]|nr:lipoprotein [Streptomyces seoulensis]
MAVSALTGCMTVHGPAVPASGPAGPPSRPAAARPDGSALPRMEQGPAREALERTGHSPAAPAPRPPAAAAPAPPEPQRPPAAPAPRRAYPEQRRQRADTPHPPPRTVPRVPNVCALGKKYGGWPRNSPQSTICDRAYGH